MNSRSRIVAGVVGLGLVAMVSAQAGEMRFPVGLSYIIGFKDVVDFYKEAKNAETSFYIPVGLVFSPYYEFDHG